MLDQPINVRKQAHLHAGPINVRKQAHLHAGSTYKCEGNYYNTRILHCFNIIRDKESASDLIKWNSPGTHHCWVDRGMMESAHMG